jgi:hypothetical protein
MSVLPISTDAIEPFLDAEKHQAGPLLQAIFEILAEGTIKFKWQKDVGTDRVLKQGAPSTALTNDKVDLFY